MLREDGFAMDDGTTARLGEQHFIMTTTTANAGKVMQHLEFCRQVLWPELDVRLVSVSDHWAQYAVAGPRSRDVLAKLVDAPFDISNEGFPRMGAGELTICGGVPARLFRVSFSGEMAYEIAVPARYGDAAIRALMQAGAEFDITPYGTEALNVLRIEKGHVGGAEINGQTTARDLGLGGMVTADKDCIGKVLAQRQALLDPARPIVVGVKPVDPAQSLTAGSHFIPLAPMRSSPTTRAISPRSPSLRCSARTSASAFSPAAAIASASAFVPSIFCAGTMWNASSPHRCSTILTESAPMAEIRLKALSPFAGLLKPGRYGGRNSHLA